MIGKISIGKSFRGCIYYCLEDKQDLAGELVMKNRAEVLTYNMCFGDKKELTQQFNEVRQLKTKLSKPVLHITLSLAPGENLAKSLMIELANDCAKSMGFENNQYVAIHHNDTGHQHIHIVANRIGFDGRTVKDNHNYQKIAAYCRKMELKHELKQVLSPRRYLSKELRQIPRQDIRKQTLHRHIRECLSVARNYPEFEVKIRQRGYEVIKARGISFLDKQKVKLKGSVVGYSLMTIEKLLALKPELRLQVLQQKEQSQVSRIPGSVQRVKEQQKELLPQIHGSIKESKTFDILLEPEKQTNSINLELLKKKKRKKQSHHLKH